MKNILYLTAILLTFAACNKPQEKAKTIENATEVAMLENNETSELNGYQIGDEATDFKLKNIDDNHVSLADYADAKGFIVIFTCNHCPYAKAYEDRIIALNNQFASQGYPVIAINPNDPAAQPEDSFELMKVRAKEKGFNFPYLLDEGQKIYPQYGATKTPHVFLLNKENDKNIVKYIGAIDNNHADANDVSEYYVQDAVNSLLAGEEIKITSTKAIGCSIKTK